MANLAKAVKQLRERLGESQQAFATRLGLSIRAVANYESDRTPIAKVLIAMHRVARESGEAQLAKVFWNAAHDELGVSHATAGVISDAHITVAAASMRLESFLAGESENLTSKQKNDLRKIETELTEARSRLANLDPYSLGLKDEETK